MFLLDNLICPTLLSYNKHTQVASIGRGVFVSATWGIIVDELNNGIIR